MLEDALAYPRRDDDWLKTVLIGGAMVLLSFPILPALVVQGYYLRVIGQGSGDDPPAFTDWGELLVDGLKAFVIIFVYGAIPFLAGMVIPAFVGTFVLSLGSAAGSNGAATGGVGVFGALLALVLVPLLLLAIAAGIYLGPAGMALLAREGRIGAAFEWSQLKSVAFTRTYLVGWLVAAAVLFVGGILAGILSFLLVGFFVSFFVNVVAYRIVGVSVEDALGVSEMDDVQVSG
jgi:hypothetical protein